VESQSGYLDVGFDLPSGTFRVIDVIVTEAPASRSNDSLLSSPKSHS
jgi:hypothetical protein